MRFGRNSKARLANYWLLSPPSTQLRSSSSATSTCFARVVSSASCCPTAWVQAPTFVRALKAYESSQQYAVEVRALVSLPAVTFAFGGTVAKTSFLILSKENAPTYAPLFVAHAQHIGFLKRGNRRVPDKGGNDLPKIVHNYADCVGEGASWGPNWRRWARLGLSAASRTQDRGAGERLLQLVRPVREFTTVDFGTKRSFHISVLDVDETGLIDVISCRRNDPASRVLACNPGDVLLSCINPRIWRVTVVPNLEGKWTCSSEFLVLRPRHEASSWELSMRLHHHAFRTVVQAMAGGTSSSRQRVNKDEVPLVAVPRIPLSKAEIKGHGEARESYYSSRLAEGRMYERLHNGNRNGRL